MGSEVSSTNRVGPQADKDGWVHAYSIPKPTPNRKIYINQPSIRKSGSIVEFQEKLEFLVPNYEVINGYSVKTGDYIVTDTIIDCVNRTYGINNARLFSANDQFLMHCPWKNKSAVKMNSIDSSTIIGHTFSIACK